MKLARLTQRSHNKKLTRDPETRPMAATSATQSSCPKDCPFFGNGCYADYGPQGIHTRKLNLAGPAPSDVIADEEAAEIRALWPRDGRPLRVHVVGDCKTYLAATIVADAVADAQSSGAGPAFGYTHAYNRVPRSAWGSVSVLASVETVEDIRLADQNGYAPAIVAETREDAADRLAAAGWSGIGCPAEDGRADCESCRLCMKADRLRSARKAIIFTTHGTGKKKAAAAIAARNR